MTEKEADQKANFDLVSEDWTRAIAIAAHPDDLEYGASSAVARWTVQGKEIVYAMVTSGEAGIQSMDPVTTRKAREAEQIQAAQIVGVSKVEFMGFPDGQLQVNLELRKAIAEIIRKHRPEVIVSLNFRESFGSEGRDWNHSDHRVLGYVLLDAVRDAANKWAFEGQLSGDHWEGVKFCLFANSPRSKHFVDVSEFFGLGMESLLAHKAYLSALSEGEDAPNIMLEAMARDFGKSVGVEIAQVFELIEL